MKEKIAIIGQGYVGLPLAIEFGKKYPTIGFDINANRIDDLKKGIDHTNEATPEQLRSANQLTFSANINDIKESNIYIVTVPTPIDEDRRSKNDRSHGLPLLASLAERECQPRRSSGADKSTVGDRISKPSLRAPPSRWTNKGLKGAISYGKAYIPRLYW